MIGTSQKQLDPAGMKRMVFEWKNKQQVGSLLIDYALKYGFISLQEKGKQVREVIRQQYHL
jgi:hypothetical protein